VGQTDVIDELELLAARLAATADYRVLRRIRPVARFHAPGGRDGLRVGAVLDIETTGLDREGDRIIELAVQRFRFDAEGRIVQVGEPRSWREDPGRSLDPAITALTGLTDADLAGRAIDEALATSILGTCDVIVAHNAGFDRPFVERRLPAIAGKAWACSCHDLDWRALGFEGRALSHLLLQMGWFYEAHRAEADVLALLYLIAHELADGATVLERLVAAAGRSTYRVHAIDSPFDSKDRLKARGYSWNAPMRFWWREVPSEALFAEQQWLRCEVYTGWGEPAVHEVTWHERHGDWLGGASGAKAVVSAG
jgi:DNA polymerase-3 subunit epsilon